MAIYRRSMQQNFIIFGISLNFLNFEFLNSFEFLRMTFVHDFDEYFELLKNARFLSNWENFFQLCSKWEKISLNSQQRREFFSCFWATERKFLWAFNFFEKSNNSILRFKEIPQKLKTIFSSKISPFGSKFPFSTHFDQIKTLKWQRPCARKKYKCSITKWSYFLTAFEYFCCSRWSRDKKNS